MLMKRKLLVASVLVMFLIPALALAASSDRLSATKGVSENNQLIVPLNITNSKDLVALDIPLSFSEGAKLVDVIFTDRVAEFEFKDALIDNENRTVMIGLISMVQSDKPDLAPGEGAVANLVFELEAGIEDVTIRPIKVDFPMHDLTYYYNDYSSGRPVLRTIIPEVEVSAIAYSFGGGSAVPTVYSMKQNSPNPFNPTTKIAYAIPEAGMVRLSVFNVLGQHVTDLVNGQREVGEYNVVWDGKDNDGAQVASGIYFYKVRVNNFSDTKKMVLLK